MRKRGKPRSPSTKLRLVAESMSLKGDALHTWCKEHGVTVDELLSWRDLALSGIEESISAQSGVSRSELETHVGELEKEIRRKNDALAEATATALLVSTYTNAVMPSLFGVKMDSSTHGPVLQIRPRSSVHLNDMVSFPVPLSRKPVQQDISWPS